MDGYFSTSSITSEVFNSVVDAADCNRDKNYDFWDSLRWYRSSRSSENVSIWSLQILHDRPNRPDRTQFYPNDRGRPSRPDR